MARNDLVTRTRGAGLVERRALLAFGWALQNRKKACCLNSICVPNGNLSSRHPKISNCSLKPVAPLRHTKDQK